MGRKIPWFLKKFFFPGVGKRVGGAVFFFPSVPPGPPTLHPGDVPPPPPSWGGSDFQFPPLTPQKWGGGGKKKFSPLTPKKGGGGKKKFSAGRREGNRSKPKSKPYLVAGLRVEKKN